MPPRREAGTVWKVGATLGQRLPVVGRALERKLVLESGLFDPSYYLEREADTPLDFDGLAHYLERGGHEGRDPSPHFRSAFYLRENPDVAQAGINPLVHFLASGGREGRNPNPFFDSRHYLSTYPEVAAAGLNPLVHFLIRGKRAGHEPVPRTGPRVHLYATCWNEIRLLPYFFRHYDPWVQRYVIFDDGSIDGSVDLLRGHPKVELRRFYRRHADSFTQSERDLYNHCWKESRGFRGGPLADYVILCNVDEHLVHADVGAYLQRCLEAGVTVVPALGFQMFADSFPDPRARLADACTVGVRDHDDCKLVLFSPTRVREIGYLVGGHVAEPSGELLAPPRDELMLQNFQMMGVDYVLERFRELNSGLGPEDQKNSWGYHYRWSKEQLLALYAEKKAAAVDTAALRDNPSHGYAVPDWWNRLPRSAPWRP